MSWQSPQVSLSDRVLKGVPKREEKGGLKRDASVPRLKFFMRDISVFASIHKMHAKSL